MNGASQLIDFVRHLKCAYEYMHGFTRDRPGTNAERLGKLYAGKIEWIFKDLISNPLFPEQIRFGLRKEWESDSFTIDAVVEKIALLLPDQRESIETILDCIIKGEKIKILTDEGNSNDADA